MTFSSYQLDRRRMKAYVATRTPEPGIRVVLAEGEGDDLWAELYPLWDDEAGWDLHFETNCREAVGIPELYDHLRRQEMTTWERQRELAGEAARLRVEALGNNAPAKVPTTQRPETKGMLTTKEVADLLGCSYGEARKRMLEGRIRAVKDGRWLRTRPEWVEEYLASNTIKPPEKPGAIYEIPLPSPRRKNHVRVKTTGIGYRFLKNRPK